MSDINTNKRLFDLVRYMRAELHEANLITDDEYVWLSGGSSMAHSSKGGSPSRERLEDYDSMRKEIEDLKYLIQNIKATNVNEFGYVADVSIATIIENYESKTP